VGRCTCPVLSAVYLQGIGDVGFSKAGADRKSGVDLRSVSRRRQTSVDDVGRRCRASVDDVGRRCRASDLVSDRMSA